MESQMNRVYRHHVAIISFSQKRCIGVPWSALYLKHSELGGGGGGGGEGSAFN